MPADEVPYAAAAEPWDESLGNHRALIRVSHPAAAVWVRIPWRRRDRQPEKKAVIVIDAATNRRVDDVLAVTINRECGDILFRPATTPGDYWVHYLPYRYEGWKNSPTAVYLPPAPPADSAWAEACAPLAEGIRRGETAGLASAQVVRFEAINEFHRFDPMEVIATAAEMQALLTAHAGRPYLLFPEDRTRPIRMTDELPRHWARSGPADRFSGEAARGEYYAFQIGVHAVAQDVADLAVGFTELCTAAGDTIPASALRCTNLGGTDWLGRPLHKPVDVRRGTVQALWFGVQVPVDARPGTYTGTLTLQPANAPVTTVTLNLTVTAQVLADAGDGDLWRHARLRWLDSTIGLDDEIVAPFTPVTRDGRRLGVLGRAVRLTEFGLPESITSTFSRNVDRTDGPARELLAAPVRFTVPGCEWRGEVEITQPAPGAVAWKARSRVGDLELSFTARLESDGHMNYRLTLRAHAATEIPDAALELPLRRAAVPYMMGLGHKGGRRQPEWSWQWDVNRANGLVWLGDINAGLQLRLKHVTDTWDLYNMKETGPYRDWSNDGKGGCTVREEGDVVMARAYTGSRRLAAGEEMQLNFGLLITPFRTLDKNHWDWRHSHSEHSHLSVPEAKEAGASIVTIHQSDIINRHINYPFLFAAEIAAYTREAHAAGLKVKFYYTVREQTNYTTEFWTLRSLGGEVFRQGEGFRLADHFSDIKGDTRPQVGSAWLREHVGDGYVPAWHDPLDPGHYDAAIATTSLSRWHNYYLEGINWMIRHTDTDGIYLDGIGFDREIMKRVRKVLQRAKPEALIDFHSGNNFLPEYGLGSPNNQYLELYPYMDSLWMGENYDYFNETPDYYLVEITGLPFGLFGEMLQSGGHPWRGMLYGMSSRLGWRPECDPRSMWRCWDEFGIKEADMIGYWDETNPVQADRENILVTIYKKPGKTLIAIGSWCQEDVGLKLRIDWPALGLDPAKAKFTAPAIEGLQAAATCAADAALPVPANQGGLWIVSE